MTIQNAICFLDEIEDDQALRSQAYSCRSETDWQDILRQHGIPFEPAEFEEAINLLHVKCQTYEQADALLHKADLVRMLLADFYHPSV